MAGARSGLGGLLKRSATAEAASDGRPGPTAGREAASDARPGATAASNGGGYGAGARILSIGIATTGVVTFAYFSLASHALDDAEYTRVSLLWAVLFVIVSVIYRPIEQLLSRTIAGRRARGLEHGHPLRTPMTIQAGFAAAFAVVALALRGRITDGLFDGSDALFWILFAAVLFYAASYFARGWLAGHQWFALYGGLVFMEATSRCLFALAVAVGITEGQTAVALGMAAAPLVSLVVVPVAFARRPPAGSARPAQEEDELGLGRGGRFALAVFCVMLAEQTLVNGAVLTANATASDAAVAGYVFNVLLIARAPLQLFQAIQGSLLPHLASLHARAEGHGADAQPDAELGAQDADRGRAALRARPDPRGTSHRRGAGDEFDRAIRVTILAIAAFALAVALALLLFGPFAMDVLFADPAHYGRWGLAVVALGMGAHLAAGTLNQAALARDHAHAAAIAWLTSAALFVVWMLAPVVDDELLRAEVGYFGAAALLCALLTLVYRRPPGRRA